MAKKKKKFAESEDFQLKCDVSPFKTHFKQIYNEKLKLLSKEGTKNFPNNNLY